jgi:hypothetical protein
MSPTPSDLRKKGRLELHIPVRVRCRETGGTEWAELSHILDVTQLGASFTLDHYLEVGRIIHLSLPLPWRLRQYDHAEELYRIYALVRWIKPRDDGRFAVGVAFVGKNPPASYIRDPSRLYGSGRGKEEEKQVEKRREGRIQAAMSIQLDLIGKQGEVVSSETTVTENISRRGASCYTSIDAVPGSVVRVVSLNSAFSTTAVVRRRRVGQDNIPRVHLEFIGEGWPLDIDTDDTE